MTAASLHLDPPWSDLSACSVAHRGMPWVYLCAAEGSESWAGRDWAVAGPAALWVTGHPMLRRPVRSLCSWTHIFPVPSAAASHKPIPCPAGTFSSLPEQTASSTCQTCPSGFYCKEAGLQAPSGWCPAGKGGGEMTSGKRKVRESPRQLSGYGSRGFWQQKTPPGPRVSDRGRGPASSAVLTSSRLLL